MEIKKLSQNCQIFKKKWMNKTDKEELCLYILLKKTVGIEYVSVHHNKKLEYTIVVIRLNWYVCP
jgi:hypothetical protein